MAGVASALSTVIVEFTGCTGSGKTVLQQQVRAGLAAQGVPTVAPRDLLPGRTWRAALAPSVENALVELIVMPRLVASRSRYAEFLRAVCRATRRHCDSAYWCLRAYRGVCRQVGLYETARRRDGLVALADEGTVHTAHYMFVQVRTDPDESELERFCHLVPRPDLVVCVEAPRTVLLERMRQRPDPPRRLLTETERERLVDHAMAVFAYLRRSRLAEACWLTVSGRFAVNKIVEQIVALAENRARQC